MFWPPSRSPDLGMWLRPVVTAGTSLGGKAGAWWAPALRPGTEMCCPLWPGRGSRETRPVVGAQQTCGLLEEVGMGRQNCTGVTCRRLRPGLEGSAARWCGV